MEEGPEQKLMAFYLKQVKQTKGLTTVLDNKAGINGKWLKPDEPYNIFSIRLIRTIIHKANFQTRDEFERDVLSLTDFIYDYILPCSIWVKKH